MKQLILHQQDHSTIICLEICNQNHFSPTPTDDIAKKKIELLNAEH